MGIFNLSNIGAAVKGLNEADEKITANKFKIRAGDLAAKRDSLIKRKNANYEIDLKAYAKESEKANAIKSLNAEGDIGSYNYATKWLSITDSGFKDYKENQQNNMITSFMTTLAKNKDADGNIIAKTYTATGASKEELEAVSTKFERPGAGKRIKGRKGWRSSRVLFDQTGHDDHFHVRTIPQKREPKPTTPIKESFSPPTSNSNVKTRRK